MKFAILHMNTPGDRERSLFALATFWGVDASYMCITETGDQWAHDLCRAKGVAVSASTLCAIEDRGLAGRVFEKLDETAGSTFFIYGYEPNARHTALASRVTGSAIAGIEAIRDGSHCSFPSAARVHARQLAGCDFERDLSPTDCCFQIKTGAEVETLLQVGGKPTFIRTKNGRPSFHWTAVDAIANPTVETGGDAIYRRCDRLVPPIIFLRATFPHSCWENPLKIARVIIDDPLLERKYGFLNYEDMVHSLVKLRYGVTTAFIPWNYRRTTRKAAHFFKGHVPAHSICVHGCDHTNNEFGVTDRDTLTQKAIVALQRMEEHHQRTGIACDEVMVFPQGKFSISAMQGLRRAGFLAVVNSVRTPTDSSGSLPLGEELLPATNSRSGLPIFTRRYPIELSAYALDLFLGKPAFIVEHHDWFAKGCGELERCVEFLKKAEPDLSWPSLADGLQRQHLRRQAEDGSRHVLFFTPKFEFENMDANAQHFVFSKSEPAPCLVENVTVDRRRVPFIHENGLITFKCELDAHQRVTITLNDKGPAALKAWSPGLKYRAQVRLRRVLSELRDNHLVKHPGLLTAAKQMVRRLKLTSDAPKTKR